MPVSCFGLTDFLMESHAHTGEPPNSVNLTLSDRKTGVPPVREDSASRLSSHETPGWKPVVHDRQDACPPAKLTVLDGPREPPLIAPVQEVATSPSQSHRPSRPHGRKMHFAGTRG